MFSTSHKYYIYIQYIKRTLGWAATVRPDIAVGFVAAMMHQSKSVSLSMDLFRLRNVPNIDIKQLGVR
jgi:hypothetical protein